MTPARTQTPLITEDQVLSPNWTRKQGPFYSVHEVAKVVFGMSSSWLRLKLTEKPDRPHTSFTTADGQEAMTFRRRRANDAASARIFLLSDIEPMARSLHAFGDIDDARLAVILRFVTQQAELFGLTAGS